MHYLYIDESGVSTFKNMKQPVFCLGGILVDEQQKAFFESEYDKLMDTYFKIISLPEGSKLHYSSLRMRVCPYNHMTEQTRLELEKEVFEIIKNSKAKLFSFTIDLVGHYTNYNKPIDPLAYGLICMLERLSYCKQDEDIKEVRIIYERFNRTQRMQIATTYKYLEHTGFHTSLDLNKLPGDIESGDPTKEPLLQFTDFWTYLPYIRERYRLDPSKYSEETYVCENKEMSRPYIEKNFSDQIYNYDIPLKRGNVVIRA